MAKFPVLYPRGSFPASSPSAARKPLPWQAIIDSKTGNKSGNCRTDFAEIRQFGSSVLSGSIANRELTGKMRSGAMTQLRSYSVVKVSRNRCAGRARDPQGPSRFTLR